MPVESTVVEARALPPVTEEYHFRLLPVATKSATVDVVPQKLCADAVGAEVVELIVTLTDVLGLSHPFTV